MTGSISTAEHRNRSYRFAGVLAASIMMMSAGGALAQTADDHRRLGQDVGKVIGAYEGATVLLELCAAKFPSLRDDIKRKYQELEAANYSIISMGRNKLYAAAERDPGRAAVDKMFKDLRDQFRTNLAATPNLKATCDASVARDAQPLKVQDIYPQEHARISEFKIGFPWRPLGCDYQMIFPVRPDVQTIQVEGQRTLRAITPEGYIPTITAACWTRGVGTDQSAISRMKSNGMQALRDFGVKNLRLLEEVTPKGYRLDAIGEKSAGGLDLVADKVIYIGKGSFLEVTIIERASAYPSLIGVQFLDWIEKSNP